jgi:hypothetical protein
MGARLARGGGPEARGEGEFVRRGAGSMGPGKAQGEVSLKVVAKSALYL